MKIICPICNNEGYLLTEKRGNQKYLYVIHIIKENDKIKGKALYRERFRNNKRRNNANN